MSYTKLFSQIVTSTIWQEDNPTRILWVTMLALSDAYGCVYGSIPGLASVAKITVAECEVAINKFQEPDRYSSTPEDEGRRIRSIAGGWKLVNYDKYMYTMSADEIREKTRERVAKFRERKRTEQLGESVTPVTPSNAGNDTIQDKTIQDKRESKSICASAQNGRFHPPSLQEVTTYCKEKKFPIDSQTFLDYYEARGWKYKGNIPMKDWKSAVRLWNSNRKAKQADDNHKEAERRLQRQRDDELFLAAENDARMRGTLREDPK